MGACMTICLTSRSTESATSLTLPNYVHAIPLSRLPNLVQAALHRHGMTGSSDAMICRHHGGQRSTKAATCAAAFARAGEESSNWSWPQKTAFLPVSVALGRPAYGLTCTLAEANLAPTSPLPFKLFIRTAAHSMLHCMFREWQLWRTWSGES